MHEKSLGFQTEVNRRKAIGLAAGAAAGVAVGTVAAQDASPEASPMASPEISDGRIVSSIEGVPDAIIELPEPTESYEGTPANGGTVRYTHLIYTAPATPRDKNQCWQEMERRLGLDALEVSEVPVSTYDEKVSALIASNDLGDLFFLNPSAGGAAAINQAISQGAFYDLTDDLTGENLERFPNLARLPSQMWEQMRFNGSIFGVPNPMPQGSDITFYRKDWADAIGATEGQNAEEVFEFFRGFRDDDPNQNGRDDTYAFGNLYMNWLEPMFRVPFGWRQNDDGSLTNAIETEEYRNAVEYQARIWEAGMIHPDAPGMNVEDMGNVFMAGQTAAMSQGLGVWWGQSGVRERLKESQPGAELAPYLPVGHDGGAPTMYLNPAYYGFVAIPADVGEDEERRLELLRIMDYLYPPFGSEEYMFQVYGIEGAHYEIIDGIPTGIDATSGDIANLLYGVSVNGLYLYHPGFPEHTKELQQIIEFAFENTVPNPTRGLYSEVNSRLGPSLSQHISDVRNDVVFGRRPIEDLDTAIEEWRTRGGDEVRADFERLIQERDAASQVSIANR